jgi:DNA-binding response OmpR family regulator
MLKPLDSLLAGIAEGYLPMQTSTLHPKESERDGGSSVATHRVLIVDDDCDTARSLAMLLEFQGFEVRTAFDGQSALKAAQHFKPEIVLLDIGMPGMDGFEVARAFRAKPEFKDLVLIALTGWGVEDAKRQCLEAGFNHHLLKPVNLNTLEALLA